MKMVLPNGGKRMPHGKQCGWVSIVMHRFHRSLQCTIFMVLFFWIPLGQAFPTVTSHAGQSYYSALEDSRASSQWDFMTWKRERRRGYHLVPLRSTTSRNNDGLSTEEDLHILKRTAMDLLRENNFRGALKNIRLMVALAEAEADDAMKVNVSGDVDDVIQAYLNRAFLPPFQGIGARNRIKLGMDALRLQLSADLVVPYNTVPKKVLLNALRALTGLNEVKQPGILRNSNASASASLLGFDSSIAAFRILQRLITGVGIRRKDHSIKQYSSGNIQEKDFNMVLNSFSNSGRMDMAHKIVALQERTKAAPPLSPVAYSILLKGYGRLGDLRNIEMLISHAEANGIQPDTVMLNSLIDAYVNCNAINQARKIFSHMTMPLEERVKDQLLFDWMGGDGGKVASANKRTYNTMLKGLANTSPMNECLLLSQEMRQKGYWDDVTTNTLIHAAIMNQNLTLAESFLDRFTGSSDYTVGDADSHNNRPAGWHPNVEAYTELLDAHAKAGNLEKAVEILQTMMNRNVSPNVITYTCLVAALARHKKIKQAKDMMKFMEFSAGLKPTAVTYNAFISGLVSSSEQKHIIRGTAQTNNSTFPTEEEVDEALGLFHEMMRVGIRPNDVTISLLVLALSRCRPTSRINEAKELVERLEKNSVISLASNARVTTALIQACGFGGDMKGALAALRALRKPDLIAVNAFLDACCRCNNDHLSLKTFRHYFGGEENTSLGVLEPDVISFSILICSLLKTNTVDASGQAQMLYDEMRKTRNISPDKTMVDAILKTVIKTGKLKKKDMHLVANVVRDAEELRWLPGQLERRKRAVQNIISSKSRKAHVWNDDEEDMLFLTSDADDALFRRKGWNQVSSGFSLWGGGRHIRTTKKRSEKVVDKFLQSKGWNDVDSGFRII